MELPTERRIDEQRRWHQSEEREHAAAKGWAAGPAAAAGWLLRFLAPRAVLHVFRTVPPPDPHPLTLAGHRRCVSRQLWWGHRIPAYYVTLRGEALETPVVAASRADAMAKVCEEHECSESDVKLEQDEDVLDTWFSSGLFPFSTLGWPDQASADLQAWHPCAAHAERTHSPAATRRQVPESRVL